MVLILFEQLLAVAVYFYINGAFTDVELGSVMNKMPPIELSHAAVHQRRVVSVWEKTVKDFIASLKLVYMTLAASEMQGAGTDTP